jgi:hypothetical protein
VGEFALSRYLCSEQEFLTNQFALSSKRLLNRHIHIQPDKHFTSPVKKPFRP